MDIEHLELNLEKRKKSCGLEYELGPPVSYEKIEAEGKRLNIVFPNQIKLFYSNINGLFIKEPHIKILSIENFKKSNINNKIVIDFAIADKNNIISFDISAYNEADQWNIIFPETDYQITLTFASFWSNKIWKWIDKRQPFWEPIDYGAGRLL